MTPQHVTVTTKLNRPPARFRQHYLHVHCAARKIGVHRQGTLLHVEGVKEVQEGTDETPSRPIQNIMHQCWFICHCK